MKSLIDKRLNTFHCIGIGGIGISAIAEVLFKLGFSVQGSDPSDSTVISRLKNLGIKIFDKQLHENVLNADVIIYSPAIKENNPELKAARESGKIILERHEILYELLKINKGILISGVHGKTTTTAMVAKMVSTLGLDPTIMNGGIIIEYNSNVHFGSSEWVVIEADESDATMSKVPNFFSIVTNVEEEHMDYYKTFEKIYASFQQFINNTPFYGTIFGCNDCPVVRRLISEYSGNAEIITYGINEKSDINAKNIQYNESGMIFDIENNLKNKILNDVFLSYYGEHNIQNSLAAVAVGVKLGADENAIRIALKNFSGVKKRLTILGERDGMVIIDDYAHHPTEVTATIHTLRNIYKNKKLICIFEPHKYTRLQHSFKPFIKSLSAADAVITYKVFAAGEIEIKGYTHVDLADEIYKSGFNDVEYLNKETDISRTVKKYCSGKTVIVFMGAGRSSAMAQKFYDGVL